MSSKCDTITLLDVSQKPFVPVRIVLEDRGLETIEWLVEKVEEILSKVGSELPNAAYLSKLKFRVTKLVVGDLEIKRENWREKNVDHYRILDDPWFILTTRSPVLPAGETVVATIEYKSTLQRSLSVCSGVGGTITCSKGVVEFIDFAPDSLQRRTWSDSAPRWRRTNPGLSVEGKCESESCDANGNMVIINMGFCDFELPYDIYKCKCPLCDTQVTPMTCGFNNCRWKWGGIQFQSAGIPITFKDKDWQVADDAYHVFKPKDGGNGTVQWTRLFICTEPSTLEPIECSLCLRSGTNGIKIYKCGHKLHTMCFMNYPHHQKEESDTNSSVCPKCFMESLKKE